MLTGFPLQMMSFQKTALYGLCGLVLGLSPSAPFLTPPLQFRAGGAGPKADPKVAVTAGCWLGLPNRRYFFEFGGWGWHG